MKIKNYNLDRFIDLLNTNDEIHCIKFLQTG